MMAKLDTQWIGVRENWTRITDIDGNDTNKNKQHMGKTWKTTLFLKFARWTLSK